MNQDLTIYGGIIAAVAGTLGLLGWGIRGTHRLHRAVDVVENIAKLLQPDDGGPGLAERLRTLESTTAEIKAELQPNHGSSTRDAINRMERRLDEIAGQTTANS